MSDSQSDNQAQSSGTPAESSAPTDASGSKGKGLGTTLGVLGFVAALGVGFYLGQWITEPDAPPTKLVEGQRYRVDLHGQEPQKGPDDALVTIVEFADFECPYCAKGSEPLMEVAEEYGDEVRVLFKHYPLPFHENAIPAARASWAGQQYGKFWELHDHLYEQRGDTAGIREHVASLGIDPDEFAKKLLSDEAKQVIEHDRVAGGELGISGTPAYVVNGHIYSGLQPESAWEEIIESELEQAEALVERGVPREEVYETLMEDAKAGREGARKPQARKPERLPGEPVPDRIYRVTADERPALGPQDALVTMVVFSDFQCPYCARLAPVLVDAVQRHHDVRVVFRNMPLPNHGRAMPAAKAALAAGRQGKFWEMHDRLFASQDRLGDAELKAHAEALGLDVAQLEADMADPALEAQIEEDVALARQFGVMSTPTSFINGRYVRGAQTGQSLDVVIAEERKKAEALVEQGVAPAQVFAKLMEDAETSVTSEQADAGTPAPGASPPEQPQEG